MSSSLERIFEISELVKKFGLIEVTITPSEGYKRYKKGRKTLTIHSKSSRAYTFVSK